MVRSIDVQQVLLQTNAIERVQQVQQQHPDVQQRYFEDQLNKEKRALKKKVKNSQGIIPPVIRQEEKRKENETKPRGGSSQKDEKNKEQSNPELLSHECGGRVDIKV